MSLENLDTLEQKITRIIERFNVLLKEKQKLSHKVQSLNEQLLQKEKELHKISNALTEKSDLEQENRKYTEERKVLKDKTLNILGKLEQIESLFNKEDIRQQSLPLDQENEELADSEEADNPV